MKQDHSSQNDLGWILDVAWRRKWVILLPFVLVSCLVTIYGLYLPNLYRSSTSIYTEPQKVPEEYVRSTVTSDLESRLRMITQQLHSRTMLLQVIKDVDLYPEEGKQQTPNEVLIMKMRKNLEVEVPGRRDTNFFVVHFIHDDPTKAMLGVSRLVTLFIDQSLQVREEQASGTTQFIEEELNNVKMVLEKQEGRIQSFKRQYIGELPNQLDANLRMLDNLHIQLSENLASQRETKNRIIIYEQEIARLTGQVQVSTVIEEDSPIPVNTTLAQLLEQRDALNQEISRLESNYTQHHPDLITTRKEMAKLEDQIREVQKNQVEQPGTSNISTNVIPTSSSNELNREMNSLRRQLNEDRPRFAAFEDEEINLRDKIAMYQRRVESAPKREQQLLALTRDYDNTKQNYEDLLNKKLEAQLSENLERRQKGEKFRILNPANLPGKPYLPNRFKIIFMGFAGGLGLGIGFALFLESLFPVFNNLTPLKNSLNVPIIMAIPQIVSPGEKRKRRIVLLIKAGAGIGLIVGTLFLMDRYVLDLAQVAERLETNIRSMGL